MLCNVVELDLGDQKRERRARMSIKRERVKDIVTKRKREREIVLVVLGSFVARVKKV